MSAVLLLLLLLMLCRAETQRLSGRSTAVVQSAAIHCGDDQDPQRVKPRTSCSWMTFRIYSPETLL